MKGQSAIRRITPYLGPKHLLFANPMMTEVYRANRQLFFPKRWSARNLAAAILIAVILLIIFVIIIDNPGAVTAEGASFAALYFVALFQPSLLHPVIAGERQKRSLEMLLSAPVSTPQIVIAKYLRSMGAHIVIFGLLTVFLFISTALTQSAPLSQPWPFVAETFAYGLTYSLCASALFGAITIFISSRSKTIGSALLSSIGLLFVFLMVVPMIRSVAFGLQSSDATSLLELFEPFVMMGRLMDRSNVEPHLLVMAPVLWLIMAAVFLFLSMTRVEQERH